MSRTPGQALDCVEARRWLDQAKHTLRASTVDAQEGFYDWACFKAHQAAELAIKGFLRALGEPAFGHNLRSLWRASLEACKALESLSDCIGYLNRLYIPSRYPDAWPSGTAPHEEYTRQDAERAIDCAVRVIEKVEECLRGCQ